MLTGQTLQISQREWSRVRGGKLSSVYGAGYHRTQFVAGNKAMDHGAAAVAGKPGQCAQGDQQLKQAVTMQAIEYAVLMPLYPPFTDSMQGDRHRGEGSYTSNFSSVYQ